MVRDTRAVGMEADGMTVKEMDTRLDELESDINALQEEMDLDRFCYKCPHIAVTGSRQVDYGVEFHIETLFCPAGFWPDESCPRGEKYMEMSARLADLRAEHERISAMYMEA